MSVVIFFQLSNVMRYILYGSEAAKANILRMFLKQRKRDWESVAITTVTSYVQTLKLN